MSDEYSITIEEAKQMREQYNKNIELDLALQRLQNNADFKLVFLENYLINESVRNVGLLGDPTLNYGNNKIVVREDLHERMMGIARFSEYLRYIPLNAQQAKKGLNDLNEAEQDYFSNTQQIGI